MKRRRGGKRRGRAEKKKKDKDKNCYEAKSTANLNFSFNKRQPILDRCMNEFDRLFAQCLYIQIPLHIHSSNAFWVGRVRIVTTF